MLILPPLVLATLPGLGDPSRVRRRRSSNLEIYHLRCPRDQQYANVEEVSPGA